MPATEQHVYYHQHIHNDTTREELQHRFYQLKKDGLHSAAKAVAEKLGRIK